MKDTRLDVEEVIISVTLQCCNVQQVTVIFLDSPSSCIASLYCSNGE